MTELLLGVNLTAYCITSLIVGNLGDRYGRRPIIILGLLIFNLGILFCVFANNCAAILFGRFLQGCGISSVAVLVYIVLADIYSVQEQQRFMGILNGTIALSMAIAPVVGSYVNLFWGWRGNFVLLLIVGLISLILGILFMPKREVNKKIRTSLKEYIPIFKSPKAIYYILTMIFLAQGYWIFIGIAPILYMQDLGVTLEYFGFYQGAMAALFSIMSFSSSYCFKKFGIKNCLYFGVIFIILFLLGNSILVVYNINNPLTITIVTLLLSLGVIYPINILWPLLLEAIPDGEARMTAIFTVARLILTAFGLQLVGFLYNGTFTPLGITISSVTLFGLVTLPKLFKYAKVFEISSNV
ncbi:MFS transporter [Rickettsia rickettsii str. R]|uniref:Bicyclomycin resistance protein n=1 Tax=Rickettsia rickettsii (strain Sheila Smith) TaxID=392021 RepID=A0A0H3AXG2_RICRS|nr:bicyclomycin resistance protein [Rickettsia rickettsii str. 'Sheila Smith']AFB21777.1 bicyclomycin resistance protein [Rickettsia rickettsii str. Brazil]AFB24005.1 bicyclomycin resistance protein [Rickettsia rickettsii str. Colombia]AFB29355.1 bicyclomycin resistance protein [Rickettsia rickettsii str. Hlp\